MAEYPEPFQTLARMLGSVLNLDPTSLFQIDCFASSYRPDFLVKVGRWLGVFMCRSSSVVSDVQPPPSI